MGSTQSIPAAVEAIEYLDKMNMTRLFKINPEGIGLIICQCVHFGTYIPVIAVGSNKVAKGTR